MIIEKKFLNKIKQFGLNSYEAKIWASLLSRGIATAGELSEISNVPRSRSYDVLESLEKKGFIVMKIDKPIKYIAVPPSEVLERVKKRTLEEADKQTQVIDDLKNSEILKELQLLHSQGIDMIEPTDLSAHLKSRTGYYNQMDSMIKSAGETIYILTTEEGLKRKAEALKKAFAKAAKKDVKIKIIAPITSKNKDAVDILSDYCEIRNYSEIKSRICIVDNKEITFSLLNDDTDESYDSALWVNSQFFATALVVFFENVWKVAKEMKVSQ